MNIVNGFLTGYTSTVPAKDGSNQDYEISQVDYEISQVISRARQDREFEKELVEFTKANSFFISKEPRNPENPGDLSEFLDAGFKQAEIDWHRKGEKATVYINGKEADVKSIEPGIEEIKHAFDKLEVSKDFRDRIIISFTQGAHTYSPTAFFFNYFSFHPEDEDRMITIDYNTEKYSFKTINEAVVNYETTFEISGFSSPIFGEYKGSQALIECEVSFNFIWDEKTQKMHVDNVELKLIPVRGSDFATYIEEKVREKFRESLPGDLKDLFDRISQAGNSEGAEYSPEEEQDPSLIGRFFGAKTNEQKIAEFRSKLEEFENSLNFDVIFGHFEDFATEKLQEVYKKKLEEIRAARLKREIDAFNNCEWHKVDQNALEDALKEGYDPSEENSKPDEVKRAHDPDQSSDSGFQSPGSTTTSETSETSETSRRTSFSSTNEDVGAELDYSEQTFDGALQGAANSEESTKDPYIASKKLVQASDAVPSGVVPDKQHHGKVTEEVGNIAQPFTGGIQQQAFADTVDHQRSAKSKLALLAATTVTSASVGSGVFILSAELLAKADAIKNVTEIAGAITAASVIMTALSTLGIGILISNRKPRPELENLSSAISAAQGKKLLGSPL